MRSRHVVRLGLAFAVLAASLGFAGPSSAASVTGTLKLDQTAYQVDNGATFTVKVIANSSVALSGVSASIAFNKAILQITTLVRGQAWAGAPLFVAGDAAAISKANAKGLLQNTAAAFFPPGSVPAGDSEFLDVTFKAVACGSVNLTMPTGRVDSTMIDGRKATYGKGISLKATGATVTVCQGAPGASGSTDPNASASIDPNASPSVDPNASASVDPNASAPAQPSPSDGGQPVASAAPSVAPGGAGTGGAGDAVSTAEQSGWLTFAMAALAIAAAGLATLILVLTIAAIIAAATGAVVVIRLWRRSAAKDRAEAEAAAAALSQAHASVTPSPEASDPTGPATDGASGETATEVTDEAPPAGRTAVPGGASPTLANP